MHLILLSENPLRADKNKLVGLPSWVFIESAWKTEIRQHKIKDVACVYFHPI